MAMSRSYRETTMSAHALESFFNPRGVAVFGASERPGALGTTVLANLIEAGFEGAIIPVNPRHNSVQGLPCRADLSGLDQPVDLAVIATPAATVPGILRQCGEAGVRGAVILSAGFGEKDANGPQLRRDIIQIAADERIRLMGPNCLGLIRPSIGLNATFSLNQALPGNLALVSQSGAMITAVLDWASNRGIGFSAVASTGDAADLDFGDVLDYLAVDPKTDGILLYIEGIRDARRFLTGLRAAARMKPVIVLKSARHSSGARAAATHTGAMIGSDDVFDAALARAGVVRVERISQWFAAARTLSSRLELRGDQLLLLTNGGGPGVMAADRATDLGLPLAELDSKTVAALDQVLPAQWSKENPVDILGDATPTRYGEAIDLCLADPGVHMLIVMLTPQAMTDPTGCAREIIRRVQRQEDTAKPVVACWLGEAMVAEGRALFDEAGIPSFTSPEAAVEALSYLVAHRRNQKLLLQVPPAVMDLAPPDIEGARLILDAVRRTGRTLLTAREAKAVLHAFHIPTTQAILARDADEAMIAAQDLGFPVVIKVSAAELSHKTDVGGVKLNLKNAQTVRQQAQDMLERLRQQHPEIEIEGITVERMADVGQARELLLGVDRDPIFGPVIAFGMGGTMVEVIRDRALALPPLNAMLTAGLIDQTRAARLLGAFRSALPAQRDAVEQVLMRVSEMVCELPAIGSLDINPLLAGEAGVSAVDARIELAEHSSGLAPYGHMAIHPYPMHFRQELTLRDGTAVTLRPIRPEDTEITQAFVRGLPKESRYQRFKQGLDELTPEALIRFTQVDYDRQMAFIALHRPDDGREVQIGVARYHSQSDGETAEFALVVDDDWQDRGLGTALLTILINYARPHGVRELFGDVRQRNTDMRELVAQLGFDEQALDSEDDLVRVSLRL